jgi:hypothetical protein
MQGFVGADLLGFLDGMQGVTGCLVGRMAGS